MNLSIGKLILLYAVLGITVILCESLAKYEHPKSKNQIIIVTNVNPYMNLPTDLVQNWSKRFHIYKCSNNNQYELWATWPEDPFMSADKLSKQSYSTLEAAQVVLTNMIVEQIQYEIKQMFHPYHGKQPSLYDTVAIQPCGQLIQ